MKTRFKDFEPIIPGMNPQPMKLADFTLPRAEAKKTEAVKEPVQLKPSDTFEMADNNPLNNLLKDFKTLIG